MTGLQLLRLGHFATLHSHAKPLPNRHIQPERYVPFFLKFVKNILTNLLYMYKIRELKIVWAINTGGYYGHDA
jgi:hypothetical protein